MKSHGKIKEAKEEPIDFIRQNALKLIEVDHSWTAFFFGKAYARRKAGFDQYDLALIEQQNQKDKAAYREMHGVLLEFSPYLEKRAKEMTYVDSSWKLMFCCINKENLRSEAKFSYAEINHIETQEKRLFKEKIKTDKNFYNKKFEALINADNSWRAFLFGRDHARSHEGLNSMQVAALYERQDLNIEAGQKHASEMRKNYRKPTPRTAKEKEERQNWLTQLKERQAERRDDIEDTRKLRGRK